MARLAWDRLRLAPASSLAARAIAVPPAARVPTDDAPLVAVRGSVSQLLGAALEIPVAVPAAAATHAMAAASIAVEELRRLERPLRLLFERVRPFLLRGRDDAAGPSVLVRFPDPSELELRLDRPFLRGVDGRREIYLRSVGLGDEVVVAGRLRVEVDGDGHGGAHAGYREPPRIPVVEALALFDVEAWTARAAWSALPWWRKLSCILLNR